MPDLREEWECHWEPLVRVAKYSKRVPSHEVWWKRARLNAHPPFEVIAALNSLGGWRCTHPSMLSEPDWSNPVHVEAVELLLRYRCVMCPHCGGWGQLGRVGGYSCCYCDQHGWRWIAKKRGDRGVSVHSTDAEWKEWERRHAAPAKPKKTAPATPRKKPRQMSLPLAKEGGLRVA